MGIFSKGFKKRHLLTEVIEDIMLKLVLDSHIEKN